MKIIEPSSNKVCLNLLVYIRGKSVKSAPLKVDAAEAVAAVVEAVVETKAKAEVEVEVVEVVAVVEEEIQRLTSHAYHVKSIFKT